MRQREQSLDINTYYKYNSVTAQKTAKNNRTKQYNKKNKFTSFKLI